jgi:uncharacterized protein
MQCKYRIIVSIDGGGIRGVVPLRILAHLQELMLNMDKSLDLTSWVDVFAGSSTGSIIGGTLMLQDEKGKSIHNPQSLLDLYIQRGSQIFSKNIGNDAENSVYPLSFVLEHFFGNITLETLKKHFLFVSYDMNTDNQFIFTDSIDRYRTMSLSNIMKACSAMPGVFPPLKLGHLLLADGMLAAKNPSEMAYNYGRMLYPEDPIIMISLGTGTLVHPASKIMEDEVLKVHNDLEELSRKDKNVIYFRFQPNIEQASNNLDDVSKENTLSLLKDTELYIKENTTKFERLFSLMKIKSEHLI